MTSPLALNNRCVELMSVGNFVQAVRCAKEAICSLKRDIAEVKESMGCEHDDLFVSIPIEALDIEAASSLRSQDSCGIFVIYSKAFYFTEAFPYQKYEKLTASVLLFNLALANHFCGLSAIPTGASQSQALQSALKIYNLVAQTLVSRNGLNFSGLNSVRLMLALFNNLGHAHALLAERHDARSCIDVMETIFSETKIPLSLEEHQFFILTIACKRASTEHSASAA